MESTLTADTQAVLLLCGELGQRGGNGLKPLGLRQYNNLATWLKTEGLRPGDLLTSEGKTKLGGLQTAEVNSDRVSPLLERGTALALVVEKWESLDALKAHAASPHMAAYGAATKEMIAKRAVHILTPT